MYLVSASTCNIVEYQKSTASAMIPWVYRNDRWFRLVEYSNGHFNWLSIASLMISWVSSGFDQRFCWQDCCWLSNIHRVSVCWVLDNDHVSSNSLTIGYWPCLRQFVEYWISIASPTIHWVLNIDHVSIRGATPSRPVPLVPLLSIRYRLIASPTIPWVSDMDWSLLRLMQEKW